MKRVCYFMLVVLVLSGKMGVAQDDVIQVVVANFSFKGIDDGNLRDQLPREFNNQLRDLKKLCPNGLKFLSDRQQDAEDYIINISGMIQREYGVATTQLSVPGTPDVIIFVEFTNNGSEITMDIGAFGYKSGVISSESEKTIYFDRTLNYLSIPKNRKRFIKRVIDEASLIAVLKGKLDESNVICKRVNKWVYVGTGAAVIGGGLYWLLKGLPKPPNDGVPPDE